MASTRLARIITVANFLPAFGLCVAHGAISGQPVPAVGLIPMAFSSGLGIYLLGSGRASRKQKQPAAEDGGESHREGAAADDDELAGTGYQHPFVIFLFDVVAATSLMVVLVINWILTSDWPYPVRDFILAAYATMPLLINFLIHVWLALRALTIGLGLSGLARYVVSLTLEPDCPHCGNRLRSDSLPTPPWFRSVSAPTLPSFRQMSFSTGGALKGLEWKRPSWLQGHLHAEGAAPLLARDEDAEGSAEPFRDSFDSDAGVVSNLLGPDADEIVVARKDKGRSVDVSE